MIKAMAFLGGSLIAMVVVFVFFGLFLATQNPVFVILEVAFLVIQLGLLATGAIIGFKESRRQFE